MAQRIGVTGDKKTMVFFPSLSFVIEDNFYIWITIEMGVVYTSDYKHIVTVILYYIRRFLRKTVRDSNLKFRVGYDIFW